MAKKGDKKDSGDEIKIIIQTLQNEIDYLESLIYLEQQKEDSSLEELDRVLKHQKEYTNSINMLALNESKKSSVENNNIEILTNNFILQESLMNKEIADLEEEIKEKNIEREELIRKNIEELKAKDESILQQKKQLIETYNSFRDFLHKSCKKSSK